ncbi:DUF6392 family protein [Acerihabitans sp. TG2]|uniref:DUF6392 family protein n=1 Tax=Acerihabitans sp. TG2 TaxID=3096008 RepID=UPI002B237FF5|nr:DUF6392 family protein [Acerihabitans sp. TG2]MEA9390591.1 DUF6392 family protein [Acerihabitans sp. TG2]
MTVNIDALIRSLGKKYRDIVDAGLIFYKTEPRGASGSPILTLDMAKEGVFLAFHRKDGVFRELSLRIQNDKIKNWVFPNELPSPLKVSMSREWMHETFGKPDKEEPPQVIAKIAFGWTERYTAVGFDMPIAMQVSYDLQGMVKKVTFLPTSELRW